MFHVLCDKLIAFGFQLTIYEKPPYLIEVASPKLDKPIVFTTIGEIHGFVLGLEASRELNNMLTYNEVKALQAAALAQATKPVCSCGCQDDGYYYYEAQLRAYANVLKEDYVRPEKVHLPESE